MNVSKIPFIRCPSKQTVAGAVPAMRVGETRYPSPKMIRALGFTHPTTVLLLRPVERCAEAPLPPGTRFQQAVGWGSTPPFPLCRRGRWVENPPYPTPRRGTLPRSPRRYLPRRGTARRRPPASGPAAGTAPGSRSGCRPRRSCHRRCAPARSR